MLPQIQSPVESHEAMSTVSTAAGVARSGLSVTAGAVDELQAATDKHVRTKAKDQRALGNIKGPPFLDIPAIIDRSHKQSDTIF
ncbi:MAG: hypothetical protein WC734_00410 [Patescibacteria group bacterium]